MKFCRSCKETKILDDFYNDKRSKDGKQHKCKHCTKAYFEQNKEKRLAYLKQYRSDNKDKVKIWANKYARNNKEKIKKWKRDNIVKMRKYFREYVYKRVNSEPLYKIKTRIRKRLYDAIKTKQKVGSAIHDLGCSPEQLKQHLESKFQFGMTWDNYGKWHVDHIQPLISFDLENRDEFLQACHYSNLQPLWAHDNLSKGSKFIDPKEGSNNE